MESRPERKAVRKTLILLTLFLWGFAAAVAAFGMLLRGSEYVVDFTYRDVAALAEGALGIDDSEYRAGFQELVATASDMTE